MVKSACFLRLPLKVFFDNVSRNNAILFSYQHHIVRICFSVDCSYVLFIPLVQYLLHEHIHLQI